MEIAMQNNTEEIKSRIDIAELIQSYVRLTKAGINYKAPCPFHSEKTASFFVSPTKQIWHCFGCNRGGDQFAFIMEIESVEFPDALKLLADRAGIKLVRENPAFSAEKNRLFEICEEATKFFEQQISRNEPVMQYVKERGLADETVKKFRIGYAPDEWQELFNYLTQKKYQPSDIEKAGLAIKSEKQGGSGIRFYDRFRNRIMFPINDANGRIIGFGGRIFESPNKVTDAKSDVTQAKYINTPETILYNKSRVLYAFDKAKQEIRKRNSCVLVEGYMDAVMSHQAGVTNAVAVSGTALTREQLAIIRRLAEELISSFDSDSAGEMATKRSLDLAAEFDFTRKVAVVPKTLGKDPADVVKENPETWIRITEGAEPVMDFYFSRSLERNDAASAEGKKRIAEMLLPEINRLTNEIERAHWVRKLAETLKVPEEAIAKELNRQKEEPAFLPHEQKQETQQKTRRELLEERLLGILMFAPKIRLALAQQEFYAELSKNEELFCHPRNRELFVKLWNIDPASLDSETIYAHIASDTMPEPYLKQLALSAEILYERADQKQYLFEAEACFREIAKEHYKGKLQSIAKKVET
ncbi:DNA primase, partial [Patescibacteria group bacterium]|nr:DNA primase [Patescibacteria group bacterium]